MHSPAAPAVYTFTHAGRQVRFGPVAFWIVVGTVVIMACWSVTSATYLAFRDDFLKSLLASKAAQQSAYEDRIAELRAQIDRDTSRQLLDQEQVKQTLDDIMRRQARLKSRAAALSAIADPTTTGAIRPARSSLVAPRTSAEPPAARDGKQSSIQGKLQGVEASLDRIESRQTAVLGQMQERYEGKVRKIRSVLAALGLKLHAAPEGIGGPFVPVTLPPPSQGFERALTRVSIARAEAQELTSTLASVPLHKPLIGAIEISSPFGVRIDPFLGIPELHTGVDLRGAMAEPVHATAAGTVTVAGWTGGYGNMVEINHGNGLATRYAHLSEINVAVGQKVRSGQVVGRLGSTGRSTGPHLHYETRIDGKPVDPRRFLSAGAKLFGG
jgi:murein DD-endopeptidase MepM/ murein hydrolase activator NlpD